MRGLSNCNMFIECVLVIAQRCKDQSGTLFAAYFGDQLHCNCTVVFVDMTETFIGKEKFKRLTEGADDGDALLLTKGEQPAFTVEERGHIEPSGHIEDLVV